MALATRTRQAFTIAVVLICLFAFDRCGNGNMMTNPLPTMTPMAAATPTPVQTPAGSSATYVYGHVVDAATGAPLGDAHVLVFQRGGGGGTHSAFTGADGAYEVHGLVPNVETSLFATKAGYVERANTIRPQGAVHFEIAVTKYRSTPGKTEYAD